jgi:putative membrane protein
MSSMNNPAPAAPALTDANIVAIVTAANDGQIEEGKAAKSTTKNIKVRELAVGMITDHTSLNKQGSDLAKKLSVTPEENDASRGIKSSADSTVAALKNLKGTDFDKAYVDHQVAEHQQVLDLLDNTLIPGAQNADLKTLLQSARPIIAAHLEHAKRVQTALGQ